MQWTDTEARISGQGEWHWASSFLETTPSISVSRCYSFVLCLWGSMWYISSYSMHLWASCVVGDNFFNWYHFYFVEFLIFKSCNRVAKIKIIRGVSPQGSISQSLEPFYGKRDIAELIQLQSCSEEILAYYLGGPSVITRVL